MLALTATPARGAWALPDWDWAGANPFDLDQADFLALYAALVVLVAMLMWLLRDKVCTSDRRPDLRDIADIDLGYCFGGNERAADVLYVALASRGAARLDKGFIVVHPTAFDLPLHLDACRLALVGTHTRKRFKVAFVRSPAHRAMLDRLLTRKILLHPTRRAWLALANWLPVALLLVFGLVEVSFDLRRGLSIGVLLISMAVLAGTSVAALRRERYLSREARASLDALRESRNRAMRSSMPDDLATAFAMFGAVALVGTAHAPYAKRSVRDGSRR